MELSIKNYHITVLEKVLCGDPQNGQPYTMKFQDGRVRMRFMKLFADASDVMNKSRKDIAIEYAELDEKNKPVSTQPGMVRIAQANMEKFRTETEKLFEEAIVVEVSTSALPDVARARQFINNSPVMLGPEEVIAMDELLEALSALDKPVEAAAPTNGKEKPVKKGKGGTNA